SSDLLGISSGMSASQGGEQRVVPRLHTEAEARDPECAQASSFLGPNRRRVCLQVPLLEIAEVESLAQAFKEITELLRGERAWRAAAKIDCARLQLPAAP